MFLLVRLVICTTMNKFLLVERVRSSALVSHQSATATIPRPGLGVEL